MTLGQYIDSINKRYLLGNATEHTFRGDLQLLLESLVPTIRATNEPKRQSCGAPDYIITQKDIPVGYIEAKDIADNDLDGKKKTGHKEQFDRYKASLNNLIFTDYLAFHLYRDGEFVTKVAIGEISGGEIKPLKDNFPVFESLIADFCSHMGQTIKSSKRLAEMMAGKARLLSETIERALTSDEQNLENSTLKDQMIAFKDILIHDITPKGFSDVYAQTIAYGLFAARYHDPTLPTFSRQEAYELIPKSNPFLKKLFGYIAGLDVDDRIKWIVDDLITIFLACNVEQILKNYGRSTKTEDPVIHFYETFLSQYDPKLRKSRGVWYTPQPVVNFIVRAVDEILKNEFQLPQGLADTSKTKIKVDAQGKKVEQEVHRVQILDPATGTGTFLAEVIKHVHSKFTGMQGIWSNYVEDQLLPRLNGFELLMASYAMAHLKLDLLLTDTGFKPTKDQRFRIFLTNSLEEHHPDTGTLWANWLSTEANEANRVKRDTPVMCVIGNPPYSVSSSNKSEWIETLTADYKKNMKERNIQPLSDDYIKFIRFGQHFIDKNGSGLLAYISNNSFIDGVIHRQMRKNLLESFDKIYILDLHGNSKKQEVCLDGSTDENVFDIMQGVSINLFLKTGEKKKNELGKVFHFDLQGKREFKYDFLRENSLGSLNWNNLDVKPPIYIFKNQDTNSLESYNKGLNIESLFIINATGVKTERDSFTIQFTHKEIAEIVTDLKNLSVDEIRSKYKLDKDGRDWQLAFAKKDIMNNQHLITKIQYRPFDYRSTSYSGITKGFMAYPRGKIMSHLVKDNFAFVSTRLNRGLSQGYNFVSRNILDLHLLDSAADSLQAFPLYLYPATSTQQSFGLATERTPNLNAEIVNQLAEKLGLRFTNEKEADDNIFAPIDILDYIYAVLHSPRYRKKYKEFLKIDFPRVPYPKDKQMFWQLVQLGGQLREIHLLESPEVEQFNTQYPIGGDNLVTDIRFEENYELVDGDTTTHVTSLIPIGRVYINGSQFFQAVPRLAWEFYIGGYQPAQKWLKDRKGRTLQFEDILHYQKIIVALSETGRLMEEIDKIEFE
jgi:predicted helicase